MHRSTLLISVLMLSTKRMTPKNAPLNWQNFRLSLKRPKHKRLLASIRRMVTNGRLMKALSVKPETISMIRSARIVSRMKSTS